MEASDSLEPTQVKAARALLTWSQQELAKEAGIAVSTVADFERGQRTPTSNNLSAIRTALEKQGVTFLSGGAVRGPVPTALRNGRPAGNPVRWIDSTDLVQWADRRASQASMPELISRLIRAEAGTAAQLEFPSDESVQTEGWDGISNVPAQSPYAPLGVSGWEIGTQREGITRKADEDFDKRTGNPRDITPAESTFVFVTPRRWNEKEAWRQRRREQKKWADVRAYDADDLVHWIEMHPGVSLWLARALSKRPPGVHTLDEAWEEWSLSTTPAMHPDLVMADRDEEAMRVLRWLREDPSVLTVESDSHGESIAFLHATLSMLPAEPRLAYETRCLVVAGTDVARILGDSLTSLIIVLENAESGLAQRLAARGHHVYVHSRISNSASGSSLRLPRPGREALSAGLKTMGIERERRESLVSDSAQSLSVLQRLLARHPATAPRWAEETSARSLVTALLAGSWDESNAADSAIIEELSEGPLKSTLKDLTPLLALSDSPIRKAGTIWKIASPRDAWNHLASHVSSQELERFQTVALKVIGSRNPVFDIDPQHRSGLHREDSIRTYSEGLRAGIAETLILLSVFGNSAPGLRDCEARISHIVRTLFDDADAARWWSLSDELKFLAEASPDAFLSAVEDDLARDSPSILTLFVEDGGSFGGEHISHLLWALEMLAWNADYLARASLILARLAQRDPGGRYSNRPKNSLRQIFLVWMPQTHATLVQRLMVLDLVRKRAPDVAWTLLLGILPTGGGSTPHSPQARWRTFSTAQREQVTYPLIGKSTQEITARLLSDVGTDSTRWSNLIEVLPNLSPEDRAKAVALLSAVAEKIKDDADRTRIRDALRKLLHHHRAFPSAGWALNPNELEPIDATLEAYESTDPVTKDSWLFDQRPELHRPSGKGWQEDQKLAHSAQQNAVLKAATGGIDCLFALAAKAPQPGLIGVAISHLPALKDLSDAILTRGLMSTEAAEHSVAHGFIVESSRVHGEQWYDDLLARARRDNFGREAILRILRALPTKKRIWQEAEAFGGEIERAYWRGVECAWIEGDGDDIELAIRKLTDAGRARDAVLVASQYIEKKLRPGSLLTLLDDAAQQPPDELESRGDGFRHDIVEIFKYLDSVDGVPPERMARLEWKYLPFFRFSDREPTQLHNALASDPQFFVQAIRAIFRPAKESGIQEAPSENPELERAAAERAFELLQSWNGLPGRAADGTVDSNQLEAWVKNARRLCRDCGRGEIGDQYIGQMLSASPSAPDGTWPAEPVREVIEICQSRELETGLLVGVGNRRGVTSRGVTDGGDQERDRATDYRAYSKATRYQWPRTSALLERLAKDLEREGGWHDDRAQRVEW